jgi:hypothetical protein
MHKTLILGTSASPHLRRAITPPERDDFSFEIVIPLYQRLSKVPTLQASVDSLRPFQPTDISKYFHRARALR